MYTQAQQTRSAFTLVELLIVILIISIIAGLLLAGAGMLWRRTDAFITQSRMSDLQGLLQETDADNGQIIELLQDQAFSEGPLRWKSLRSVVTTLRKKHGLDISNVSQAERYLPPNLASLYDDDIGCYPGTKKKEVYDWNLMNIDKRDGIWLDKTRQQNLRSVTLDRVLVWRELIHFGQKQPFFNNDGEATGTPIYEFDKKQTYFWWKRNMAALAPYTKSSTERWAWLHRHTSTIDESLDQTREVVPNGLVDKDWYRQRWPILKEERHDADPTDPASGTFIQSAWPESDWNQADPGSIRPVWAMPWGERIILRQTGRQHSSQYMLREVDGDLRSLADLCPLDNLELLVATGLIPSDDRDRYRNNRNREAVFNDRWGNPLLVASALFIAPRYYLDPSGLQRTGFYDIPTANTRLASHGKEHECHTDLLGGRDYLLNRCQDIYGYHQAAYLAITAPGPLRAVYGDDNPIESVRADWTTAESLSWTAVNDDEVFRAIWLQACELNDAADWTDEQHSEALWSGINEGKEDDLKTYLSSPFTLTR